MIEVKIDVLPKTLNELNRLHWGQRSREAKRWKDLIYWHFLKHRQKKPFTKVEISYVRGSSRQTDFDNNVGSTKPITDALVKCGIIIDDNPDVVVKSYFGWEKAAPKAGYIKIIIVPL